MADKTIDILFSMKGKGAKEVSADFKRMEDQIQRTREALEGLSKAGKKMMVVGAAIIAPFALAMKKYIDTAKNAEAQRVAAAKKAMDTLKDLEGERVDVVRSTSDKIKSIDEQVSDNRVRLAEINKDAERESRDVRANLVDTLRDLSKSSKDLAKDYKRAMFDIMHPNLSEKQSRKLQLQRMKEDYIAAQKEIRLKRIEAIKKAAEEEKRIEENRRNEAQKIAIENQKLAAQKQAALNLERILLADIAKREAQANADRIKAAKEIDAKYKGIADLMKEWEASQNTIGEVTATVLLPALREAVTLAGQIADFAKEHPGAIKAVLSVGGFLIVAGGILKTIAEIGGAINFIRGAIGVGSLATAATTTATAAGGTGIVAGFGTALTAVLSNPATWIVAGSALAVYLSLPILNKLLGMDVTWRDIGTTLKQLWKIGVYYWVQLFQKVGGWLSSLGSAIFGGFASLASAIRGLFGGTKDSGGMISKGIFANAGSPEFVMSHSTTKAAESLVGGSLTQQKLLQALAGGGSRRITYQDNRRIDSSLSPNQRRQIANDTLSILNGAL